MKLKSVLSLTPLFLLMPPAASAQSTVSGTLTGGYTYTCEFVSEGVVLARLTGSPGTLTVTAGTGSSQETESGTGSITATAPATGETTSGCTFTAPGTTRYSVTITSN